MRDGSDGLCVLSSMISMITIDGTPLNTLTDGLFHTPMMKIPVLSFVRLQNHKLGFAN